jgi:hypothetical protein
MIWENDVSAETASLYIISGHYHVNTVLSPDPGHSFPVHSIHDISFKMKVTNKFLWPRYCTETAGSLCVAGLCLSCCYIPCQRVTMIQQSDVLMKCKLITDYGRLYLVASVATLTEQWSHLNSRRVVCGLWAIVKAPLMNIWYWEWQVS